MTQVFTSLNNLIESRADSTRARTATLKLSLSISWKELICVQRSFHVRVRETTTHVNEQRNVEKSNGGEVRAKTFSALLSEVGHRPAHGAGNGVFLRASPELRRGQVTAAGQAEGVGAVEQTGRPVGALGGKVVQADNALNQVEDGVEALAGDAARLIPRLSRDHAAVLKEVGAN